jgi:hypothetical protein
MKKIILAISAIFLLATACNQALKINFNPAPAPVPPPTSPPQPPVAVIDSGIIGNVTLSPICPVETDPPTPGCAPKPYQAEIVIKTADNNSEVSRFTTNADGTFKFNLSPGNYLLVPQNKPNSISPVGRSQNVIVFAHQFTKVTINYDTGIR